MTCKPINVPVVFCDSGGFSKGIQRLDRDGFIIAKQGLYEGRSKKAKTAKPSAWDFGNPHISFSNPDVTFGDTHSPKHADIVKIIGGGPEKRNDALQLDSAHISQAMAFTTSDLGDIVAHRAQLEPLLGLRIFHIPSEECDFIEWLVGATGCRAKFMVSHIFVKPTEADGYRVFDHDIEGRPNIFYHGTPADNLPLILKDGFKAPGGENLVSITYTKRSIDALTHVCDKAPASPRAVVAVTFESVPSPGIADGGAVIYVYDPELQPSIVAYCIVPAGYYYQGS